MITTPTHDSASNPPAPATPRWLVAILLLWNLAAGLALAGLLATQSEPGREIIRIDPAQPKPWTARLRDQAALFRLNFHWAVPWIALAPSVLWIGSRFPFEPARWPSRSAVLLTTAATFVGLSHTLNTRLTPRQSVIIMVNYETATTSELPPGSTNPPPHTTLHRAVSNRFTALALTDTARSHSSNRLGNVFALPALPDSLHSKPPLAPPWANEDLPPPNLPGFRRWSAALDGMACVALLGLAHAGAFHRRYRERERQAATLSARLQEARLLALQTQLHPHFLFNTLNGIATLLRRDPAAAEDMLTSLADLLRIALHGSNRQEIPLREELDFLDRYLALQQMRFADRLTVSRDIPPELLDCLVPALLLQPLVENALRHGLEPSERPGHIRLTAEARPPDLHLAVEDNGVGLASHPPAPSRPGLGLANVRERLHALYGSRPGLRLDPTPGGGLTVRLRLPLHPTPPNPPSNLPQRP